MSNPGSVSALVGSGGTGATTPTKIPAATGVVGVTDARALAVGGLHSCVLRTGGKVVCWGDNTYGQLGGTGGPGVVSVTW